jgi:hypothetical protein
MRSVIVLLALLVALSLPASAGAAQATLCSDPVRFGQRSALLLGIQTWDTINQRFDSCWTNFDATTPDKAVECFDVKAQVQ